MAYRIIAYVTLGLIALLWLMGWQDKHDGRLEEREQSAVTSAIRWHKNFVTVRDSAHRLEAVVVKAVAKSHALRDSVRVINDTTLLVDTVRVNVPQIVVRRLTADSAAIDQLTSLVAVQKHALGVADTTIAAYQKALGAAQAAGKCRLLVFLPCPNRRTTALLTAGVLLVAKVYLGGV